MLYCGLCSDVLFSREYCVALRFDQTRKPNMSTLPKTNSKWHSNSPATEKIKDYLLETFTVQCIIINFYGKKITLKLEIRIFH